MSEDLKFKPCGKRLLVKLTPVKEKKTKGGVILPDTHVEESRIGTIMAVGEEVDEEFKPGNTVVLQFFCGDVVHFPGEGMTDDTVRIITQSEIWGLIEKE